MFNAQKESTCHRKKYYLHIIVQFVHVLFQTHCQLMSYSVSKFHSVLDGVAVLY